MNRRNFLGILAAGVAPAIVSNPMKLWIPKKVEFYGMMLSEESLEQAIIDIGNMTNDKGLKIIANPNTLLIKPEIYQLYKKEIDILIMMIQ